MYRFLLLTVALVTVARDGEIAAQQPSSVLLKNANIFDGTSDKLSARTSVLVSGNKITRIATEITAPENSVVIDADGRTLMPGLIDNHVHLYLNGSTPDDLFRNFETPEVLIEATAKQAEKMLFRGFTTVRDMGGPVFEVKNWIDGGKRVGPRIYPSGAMISQTAGHGDARLPSEKSRRFFGAASKSELLGLNFIADGRADVLAAVRENLRFGASQIKLMAGGGASSVYDPLDVTQYTLDELRAAVEAAEDWGTYVTVHAYTPKAVRRAVEAGVLCIEHGQMLDEETLKFLSEKGIWLSSQVLDPAPPTAPQLNREKKQLVVDGTDFAYRMAKKYRLKLAWGTDQIFEPTATDKQSSDILKLEKWFTAVEALRMITRDNAELLSLSGKRNPYPGKLGVIEEGALADLLIVDGDPLVELKLLAEPEKNLLVIMKDGKVFKNRLP